jgi:hypothetical protein
LTQSPHNVLAQIVQNQKKNAAAARIIPIAHAKTTPIVHVRKEIAKRCQNRFLEEKCKKNVFFQTNT